MQLSIVDSSSVESVDKGGLQGMLHGIDAVEEVAEHSVEY